MLYRLYSPEDFDQLYAIEEKCFQPPFRFARRYMQQLVDRSDAATWIAKDEGVMAGFGLADWGEESGAIVAYIETLEVSPERRGKGIGPELLRRIEESARTAGAGIMWLHVDEKNANAIRLYEANGYACRGRQENYYTRGGTALIYVKQLTDATGS